MSATSRISRCRAGWQRLLTDRRGVAAVFLAIALVPLMGGVGLAVDSALGYLLKTRIVRSLDAAGLAAGRVAGDADAEAVARDYFNANFGAGDDAVVTSFGFSRDATGEFVTLTARAETPTRFARIFGKTKMEVAASTRIQRLTRGMELALVLDNTGSMSGAKFNAMQQAALNLIDIVFGGKEEVENLWVSLTPYVATVNVGKSHTAWLDPADQVFTRPSLFGTEGWKGCVMAQPLPYDANDTPPSVRRLASYLYPQTTTDNNWPPIRPSSDNPDATATGPNLACPTAITPLTRSKSKIVAALKAMKAWRRGGTTSNLGMTWGWRTISPRWRGRWGDPELPLDYDGDKERYIDKVAVILTDGENTFYDLPSPSDPSPSDYTAYGRINAPGPVGLAKSQAAEGAPILNARLKTTCTAMKGAGIRIYSITFGVPSAAIKDVFRACATSQAMYYNAPTSADLAVAFKSIGGQLASLRIVN